MKNKILVLSCMVMFIISILGSNVFATISSATCTLNTPKSQYEVGEEVVVTFRLENLDADKGIISYSAVLDYDKTALEYVSCSGVGKWVTPSYNEENGMLIADRNEDYSPLNGEDLCTITFKAISANSNAKIKLSEITLANGGHDIGTHADLEKSINITESVENPDNNNEGNSDNPLNPANPDNNNQNPNGSITENNNDSDNSNNNNGSNTNNSNNNNSNEKANINSTLSLSDKQIPKLGANMCILALIGIEIAVAIILFIRMKLLDKKIKKNS